MKRITKKVAGKRGKIGAIYIRDDSEDRKGWQMILIHPDGRVEYPREGYLHKNRAEVYRCARAMYAPECWGWRERDKSILLDYPDLTEEEEEVEKNETLKESKFWSEVKRNWKEESTV
ncbi:MAG: hypothetical protein DDT23_00040 [candidate division WS2 bacterium]|nr:hypothetical protein [Candidatus Lithacetigena glycinireducens]